MNRTEKQHVANDYARQLDLGVKKCESIINFAYAGLMRIAGQPIAQQFCHALNISECSVTETGNKIAVTLWNPRGQPVTHTVRLPVATGSQYAVTSPTRTSVSSQLVDIPNYVRAIPERVSNATKELVFEASLPAVGFATYFVEKTSGKVRDTTRRVKAQPVVELKAKSFTVRFDSRGMLKEVRLANGQRVAVEQDFR